LILFLILSIPPYTHARVVFFDDVAVKGQPVMLRAETRGRFFPSGGQMVEFFVNGRSIGKNLSGGDGIAMKEFVPGRRGLYRITVKSGGEEDEGYLLSLNRGEGVVLIDIEGGLFDGLYSMRPRDGSREAIRSISKRFPVVYLKTGVLTRELLEEWLEEKDFEGAPVLEWDDGGVFDMIYDKGLRVKAVVGSAQVVSSIRGEGVKAFSFEEVDDAEWVKDWKEVEEGLRAE